MTLDAIGTKHSTDKASFGHAYLPLYEFLFARFKHEPAVSILEVGFQFGFSLRTWKDYFPQALICGIDTCPNDVSFPPESGIALIIGNAYTPEMVARLGGMQFDIAIDDGDHARDSQAFFVRHYAPMLSPEGILAVEDVESLFTAKGLKSALPAGFQSVLVDLRKDEGGMPDSILFVAYRV